MITLPITDDLRIKTDKYQWMLQKRRPRTRRGEAVDEWTGFKFFPTFEQAIKEVGRMMICDEDAEGFLEATRSVQRVAKRLSALMPEGVEVSCRCEGQHTVINTRHGTDCPLRNP